MAEWVTLHEATLIAASFPYGIPADFDKWLNMSQTRIEYDPKYAFPSAPTERMKNAVVLLALITGSGDNTAQLIQNGVSEFSIGKFSQKFSEHAQNNPGSYPIEVSNMLAVYRSTALFVGQLSRTYPSN